LLLQPISAKEKKRKRGKGGKRIRYSSITPVAFGGGKVSREEKEERKGDSGALKKRGR